MLFHIIGWLIIGLIIGGIARLLMPGRDPIGCLATALLGIGGSFVGGLIGRAIWGDRGGYYHPGFLISILGAIILLWLWRMIRRA